MNCASSTQLQWRAEMDEVASRQNWYPQGICARGGHSQKKYYPKPTAGGIQIKELAPSMYPDKGESTPGGMKTLHATALILSSRSRSLLKLAPFK